MSEEKDGSKNNRFPHSTTLFCCYIQMGVFCTHPVAYQLPVGEGYTYVCEYHAGLVGGETIRLEGR